MELMAAAGLQVGISGELAREILNCVTTEEVLEGLKESGKLVPTLEHILSKVCFYLNKRAAGKMQLECIMYSNDFGELAKSSGALELLQKIIGE